MKTVLPAPLLQIVVIELSLSGSIIVTVLPYKVDSLLLTILSVSSNSIVAVDFSNESMIYPPSALHEMTCRSARLGASPSTSLLMTSGPLLVIKSKLPCSVTNSILMILSPLLTTNDSSEEDTLTCPMVGSASKALAMSSSVDTPTSISSV